MPVGGEKGDLGVSQSGDKVIALNARNINGSQLKECERAKFHKCVYIFNHHTFDIKACINLVTGAKCQLDGLGITWEVGSLAGLWGISLVILAEEGRSSHCRWHYFLVGFWD